MIRINLLPYRAERRQMRLLQHVIVGSVGLFLAIFICVVMNMTANSTLEDLQSEFTSLTDQNAVLEKQIGEIAKLDTLRDDVQKKLNLIDELQNGRFRSLEMLIGVAEMIPENVWLDSLSENEGNIKIDGKGESNKAVANFMRALDASPLFEKVALEIIDRSVVGTVPVRQFSLQLALEKPPVNPTGSTTPTPQAEGQSQ